MNSENQYLGSGWGFPPTFSALEKSVQMVAAEEDILQSLRILFSTQLGERVMRSDYGCDLSSLMFENITATLQTKLKDLIETAILLHEPRIVLENVLFESIETEGILNIEIIYVVSATNTRRNFVYPYYIEEGNQLFDK